MAGVGPAALFRVREYRAVWLGVVPAQLGDWLRITAFGWFTLELGGNPAAVTTVMALGVLPQLLLTLVGGVVADRWAKKRVLQVIASLQVSVSAGFFVVALLSTPTITLLAVVAFTLGSLTALWQPVYLSLLPELVPTPLLERAMAFSLTALYASRALGPLVAGVLIGSLSIAAVALINVGTYMGPVIALLFVAGVHRPVVRPPSPLTQLRKSIALLRSDALLMVLWAATAALSFFLLPPLALLPVFVQDVFLGGPALLGVLTSLAGVGQLAGALLMGFGVHIPGRTLPTQLLGYLFMALLLLGFAASGSVPLAIMCLFVFNVLHGLLSPRVNAIVQQHVPEAQRGASQALFLVVFGFVPLGQFAIGALATSMGAVSATAASAMVFAVIATGLYAYQRAQVG